MITSRIIRCQWNHIFAQPTDGSKSSTDFAMERAQHKVLDRELLPQKEKAAECS